MGVVVGPSNTPAREPVHSRSRVNTSSATRSLYRPGCWSRAADAQHVRALLDHGQHVGDGRARAAGEPLVEQVDGAAEDDFLGVADRAAAHQRAQGHQQGQPPAADLPPQRVGVWPGMRRSAWPSGPVSSGLIRSRPRPIRITCPPRCSVSSV